MLKQQLLHELLQLHQKYIRDKVHGMHGQVECTCSGKLDYYWAQYDGFQWFDCNNECFTLEDFLLS